MFVHYDGEDVIQARRQVSSQWLFLRERGLGHAARRQQGLGGARVSCACSRLFVLSNIVGWRAGTGRPGGGPVTGLSVLLSQAIVAAGD